MLSILDFYITTSFCTFSDSWLVKLFNDIVKLEQPIMHCSFNS